MKTKNGIPQFENRALLFYIHIHNIINIHMFCLFYIFCQTKLKNWNLIIPDFPLRNPQNKKK